jgi:hypothetical protein
VRGGHRRDPHDTGGRDFRRHREDRIRHSRGVPLTTTETSTETPGEETPLRDPSAPANGRHRVRHPAVVVGAPVATAGLLTAGSVFGPVGLLVALGAVGGIGAVAWWLHRRRNRDDSKSKRDKRRRRDRSERRGGRREWRMPRWGGFGSVRGATASRRHPSGSSGRAPSVGRRNGLGFGRLFGRSGALGTGRSNGGGSRTRRGGSGPGNGTRRRGKVGSFLRGAGKALSAPLQGGRAPRKGAGTNGRQGRAQGLLSRIAGRARRSSAGRALGRTARTAKGGLGRVASRAGKQARRTGGRMARSRAGQAIGRTGRGIGAALGRTGRRAAGGIGGGVRRGTSAATRGARRVGKRVGNTRAGRAAKRAARKMAAGRTGRILRGSLGRVQRSAGRIGQQMRKRAGGRTRRGWGSLGTLGRRGRSVAGGGSVAGTRTRTRPNRGRIVDPFEWSRRRKANRWRKQIADRKRERLIPGSKPVKLRPVPELKPHRGDVSTPDDMPAGRRSVGTDDGPGAKILPFRQRTTKRNVKGTATMPNPYNGAIEALGGSITVENALAALDYVYGLPALIGAIADRLTRDGATYVNDFPTDPRAGEVAQLVGSQMRKMHDPVERFGVVFEKVHARELERLRSPRHNEQAWDVSVNVR